MFPLAARFLPYKWFAVAGLVAAVALWGALGWYGKRAAELEFERYRGQQAQLVVRQQEQIIAEQIRVAAKAREVSDAYQKGARESDARWAHRLRHQPRTGGGALPAAPGPAGGPDAAATCEQRLHGALRQLDAVDRAARAVAQALHDAERTREQLAALQAFNCGR